MKQFSGPIPGQSLTNAPKNFPWERPPEINDPEEAIQMHLTRLSRPDMLEGVLDLIELDGIDIQTLVTGIMRGAVAKGLHSIDVGMIAAPVVHEYIKQAAKAAGIPAEDGFEEKGAKEKQRQEAAARRAKKILTEMGAAPKEVVAKVEETKDVEEKAPTGPAEMPVGSKGLMSRGAM